MMNAFPVESSIIDDDFIAEALGRARNRISITIRPGVDDLHPELWGASAEGMSAREWRVLVHELAPHDLQTIGIPHAWTRWNDACGEICRARTLAINEVQEIMSMVRVGIEATKCAAERGAEGWVASCDLQEVALRLRGGGMSAAGMPTLESIAREIVADKRRTQSTKSKSDVVSKSMLEEFKLPESEWPELRELPEAVISAPILPEQLIPEPFRVNCIDIAERMNVHPEAVTVPMIVSACAVIGRRLKIAVKQNDNWIENLTLWGMHIAPPAHKKSPTQNQAMREIKRLEKEAHKKWLQLQAEYQEKKKADPNNAISLKEPSRRRYLVGDITVEKLGEIVRDNSNGVLVSWDELAGWFASMEKENQKGARKFFLSRWSGNEEGGCDRIARGSVYVPHLALSIYGGIQPGPLMKHICAAHESGIEADGLLQRFSMTIWPDDKPPFVYEDRAPDYQAMRRVREIFEKLDNLDPLAIGAEYQSEYEDEIPVLRFSKDAQEVFRLWLTDLERRLEEEEIRRVPAFQAHLAKYRKLMPTLALIFHLIGVVDGGVIGPVSADAAALAVEWCDYLEAHARKVYGIGGMSPGQSLAKHIERGDVKDGVSPRMIAKREWKNLKTSDEVRAAVAEIASFGWCRIQDAPSKNPKGGRPRQFICIHPDLREGAEVFRG